jgi:hypothetical protein
MIRLVIVMGESNVAEGGGSKVSRAKLNAIFRIRPFQRRRDEAVRR